MADVLPKKTKKMLLFVSPGNSIWTKFPEKQPIGQNTIASRLGVSHGTIPNWKNGSPIFPDTAEHIFKTFSNYIDKAELSDEARREIIDTFNKFRENYKSEETTVYNTGDDLGMEMEDCQKIIDHVIYARSPRPHYGTAAIAQEYFERYGGIYKLWLKRDTPHRPTTWLQCPLRVRYVLQIGNDFTLRCKVNVPTKDLSQRRPYWEYDGFLVARPNNIFWNFEKRQKDRNDQINFITDNGRGHMAVDAPGRSVLTMTGSYLTVDQDAHQSIVSSSLLMQWLNIQGSPKEIADLMHSLPLVVGGKFASELDSTLAELDG